MASLVPDVGKHLSVVDYDESGVFSFPFRTCVERMWGAWG